MLYNSVIEEQLPSTTCPDAADMHGDRKRTTNKEVTCQ